MLTPFAGRDRFLAIMSNFTVNSDVKLEMKRKDGGKTETVTARLAAFTEDVPEKLPIESTKKRPLRKNPNRKRPPSRPKKAADQADPKKDKLRRKRQPKRGQAQERRSQERTAEEGRSQDRKRDFVKRTESRPGRNYWVFIPRTYDPNVAHGLVVWLHPGRPGRARRR